MLEAFFTAFLSENIEIKRNRMHDILSALRGTKSEITIVINKSHGGVVDQFIDAVREVEELPMKIEFNGPCVSACTMMLKLHERACATDKAVFYFHSVRGRYADGREVRFDRAREDAGNKKLMDHYPDNVKLAIMAAGGLPFNGLLKIKGTDILPECP